MCSLCVCFACSGHPCHRHCCGWESVPLGLGSATSLFPSSDKRDGVLRQRDGLAIVTDEDAVFAGFIDQDWDANASPFEQLHILDTTDTIAIIRHHSGLTVSSKLHSACPHLPAPHLDRASRRTRGNPTERRVAPRNASGPRRLHGLRQSLAQRYASSLRSLIDATSWTHYTIRQSNPERWSSCLQPVTPPILATATAAAPPAADAVA